MPDAVNVHKFGGVNTKEARYLFDSEFVGLMKV